MKEKQSVKKKIVKNYFNNNKNKYAKEMQKICVDKIIEIGVQRK